MVKINWKKLKRVESSILLKQLSIYRIEVIYLKRQFVNKNYLDVKNNFPDFLFLIRECEGVDPYVIARYSKFII